jgi:hypothetical protein
VALARQGTSLAAASAMWCAVRQGRPRFSILSEDPVMGKYFIAWLLGVPLFVLVLIYLIFH